MKPIKLLITALTCIVASGFMLTSCEKTFDSKFATQNDLDNQSQIRVFIATVNAARNYVYVDGKPLNGASLVSGSVFPSTSAYAAKIDGGFRAFLVRDTSSTATQVPLSFAQNFQAGKNYTVFLYDTITSPKQKTVETNFVTPTDTTCRLRFANFIYNPTDVPAIDVFSFTRNANIFTNVPVAGVTDFISYPSLTTIDTLYIREAGSSVNIIKVAVGGTTFFQKRNYTLVYRGSHRGTRTSTLFTDK